MAGYTKNVWSDRAVSTPNKYTKSGETSTSVTLIQDPGTVTNAGTPVTAAKMNNIEQGIADAVRKDGSEPMTGVLNNIAGYQWNGITMVQTRVHSSGTYIEWNKGGTWYPVSGNGYYTPSASTVIQSDATARSVTSDNQFLLAMKFMPLFTGEVTVTVDIHSNGSGTGTLGIYSPVNPLFSSSSVLATGYRAANTVNTSVPVGTVLTGISDVFSVNTSINTTSATFVTLSQTIGVTANIPIFLIGFKQNGASATCFIQNLSIKGDVTRY